MFALNFQCNLNSLPYSLYRFLTEIECVFPFLKWCFGTRIVIFTCRFKSKLIEMKQLIYLLGIIVLASSFRECKSSSESKTQLYKYKWWLKTLHAAGATEQVTQQKAFIRFDEAKKSAGGNGGCNVFGSTLSVSKGKLGITQLFSTKMYCEQFQRMENQFLALLGTVTRYEAKDSHLSLYKDNELVLEFEGDVLTE